MVELARCVLILCLSEEISKDEDENDLPAESARITITHHIKGIEEVALENKNDMQNTENKVGYQYNRL